MAGGIEVHIDYAGLGKIMRGPDTGAAVSSAAEALASELRGRGFEKVFVNNYVTDRAAASVTIAGHSAGAELKTGALADAAAAIGLEMNRRTS